MNRAFLAEDFLFYAKTARFIHQGGGMEVGATLECEHMKNPIGRPAQRQKQARASLSRVSPKSAAAQANVPDAEENRAAVVPSPAARQVLHRLRQVQAF